MTTKAQTHTFSIEAKDARYLANVALSGASRDDVTPVICGANFTVSDGVLRVMATDRYRCHTAVKPVLGEAKDQEWIIHRDTLTWISKNAGFFTRRNFGVVDSFVVFTVTEADPVNILDVRIVQYEGDGAQVLSYSAPLIKGNFPPVIRLFETARAAEESKSARVKLDWFAKARVLADNSSDSPSMKFTKTEGSNKPGPLLLAWQTTEDAPPYAEAIIQPYTGFHS